MVKSHDDFSPNWFSMLFLLSIEIILLKYKFSIVNFITKYEKYINKPGIFKMTFSTTIRNYLTIEDFLIFRIAAYSWLMTTKHSYLLLFFDFYNETIMYFTQTNLIDVYGKERIHIFYFSRFYCSNRPVLSEWVNITLKSSFTRYITFLNSDIILPKNWYPEITKFFGQFKYPPLFIANRHDLVIKDQMKFAADRNYNIGVIYDDLIANMNKNDEIKATFFIHGIDVITFDVTYNPLTSQRIPAFCLGCPRWDDFIHYVGNQFGITVCYGKAIPVYHVQAKTHKDWHGNPECKRNYIIHQKMPHNYLRKTLCSSTEFNIKRAGMSVGEIHQRFDHVVHRVLKGNQTFQNRKSQRRRRAKKPVNLTKEEIEFRENVWKTMY